MLARMKPTPEPDRLPTDAEMEILAVLWQRGPSTVRDVYETLARKRELGYTTVLKFLQIMTEKGLVRRDESRRTHVYETVDREDRTQQRLLRDLLDRVFGGSKEKLLLQALAATKTTPDELAELRKLLDGSQKPSQSGKPQKPGAKGDRP
jgi:predicted transcriptional regulator